MEHCFTLATIFFFTLAGMKPEVRLEAGTIYDSDRFSSIRQQRARESADAGDEVGAAGVFFYLRDEG